MRNTTVVIIGVICLTVGVLVGGAMPKAFSDYPLEYRRTVYWLGGTLDEAAYREMAGRVTAAHLKIPVSDLEVRHYQADEDGKRVVIQYESPWYEAEIRPLSAGEYEVQVRKIY